MVRISSDDIAADLKKIDGVKFVMLFITCFAIQALKVVFPGNVRQRVLLM